MSLVWSDAKVEPDKNKELLLLLLLLLLIDSLTNNLSFLYRYLTK